MTYNEIIRRLNNIRRRLSMNSKDDLENEKALESAIEMVKGVTSGTIVPIEWNEIKTRPLTDEEREEYSDDVCFIFECNLPSDDVDVLVTTKCGNVEIVEFYRDYETCFFGDFDEDDLTAWAYLPKPFKKT